MNPEKPIQIRATKPVQAATKRRPLHRVCGLFSVLFGVALWTITFTGIIQAAPSTQQYAVGSFDDNGQPGADIQQPGNESSIRSYDIPDPIALEQQLIALINQTRWSQGLPAFKVNDALARAAQTQSQVLSKSRKVALVDADGKTPLQRAQNAGYAQPLTILELISAGYSTPEQVVAALRANSSASKNLFSPCLLYTSPSPRDS